MTPVVGTRSEAGSSAGSGGSGAGSSVESSASFNTCSISVQQKKKSANHD